MEADRKQSQPSNFSDGVMIMMGVVDILRHKLRVIIIALACVFCFSASAEITTYTAHGGPIKGLAMSEDQQYLISTSFDYSAVIWQASDMTEMAVITDHDAAVNIGSFSPDGKWLATGGDDHLILLWNFEQLINDAENAEPIRLEGHMGKVVHLNFSEDSQYLASASWDGKIGIWPIANLSDKRFINGHRGPVNAVQFSDDGSHLYSAGYDGHLRYWDLDGDIYIRSLVRNGWGVNIFRVFEDKNQLYYGTVDGAIKLVSLDTRQELVTVAGERDPVLSLYWSPSKGQIAFGNSKGRVVILDSETGEVEKDFVVINGPSWGLVMMPDQKTLMVAGLDDYLTAWEIDTAEVTLTDANYQNRRFHPTGEMSNGERQFARKCSVCHTLIADDKRRAGPTLYGVFGRKAGSVEGYSYSDALLTSDIIWDEDTINALFRDGPDQVTPGTKMPIQRMKNDKDRQDLITFLKTMTTTDN